MREIEAHVSRSIARYGIAGKVRIEGDQVVLDAPDASVATEVGDLPATWAELSAAERQRRVSALARSLVLERGGVEKRPAPRSARGALLLVGAIVATAGAWYALRPEAAPPVELGSAPRAQGDDEALEIEKRACEASSARAERGETLTGTDTRGWVVELSLLRRGEPDVVFDPGLLAFIERAPGRLVGRFVWAGAREISSLEGPGTEVEVVDAGAVGKNMRGASLLFKGRYVSPYFSAERRAAFVRTASAIAERLAATYVGLEARCAHLGTRALGAWFRGPDAPGTAAALVWFMGERRGKFDAVFERADVVDGPMIERWISAHGGVVASNAPPASCFGSKVDMDKDTRCVPDRASPAFPRRTMVHLR